MPHRTTRDRWFAALSALVAGGALLAGCGSDPAPTREWTPADHGQPQVEPGPDQDRVAPEEPTEEPTARAARALWNATCASCHGRDGRGHGEAPPPGAHMPDFTLAAFQQSRTDAQLAQAIADGRNMMPSFGKQLNPQGIAALVEHVRRFGVAQAPAAGDTTGSAPADSAPTN